MTPAVLLYFALDNIRAMSIVRDEILLWPHRIAILKKISGCVCNESTGLSFSFGKIEPQPKWVPHGTRHNLYCVNSCPPFLCSTKKRLDKEQ